MESIAASFPLFTGLCLVNVSKSITLFTITWVTTAPCSMPLFQHRWGKHHTSVQLALKGCAGLQVGHAWSMPLGIEINSQCVIVGFFSRHLSLSCGLWFVNSWKFYLILLPTKIYLNNNKKNSIMMYLDLQQHISLFETTAWPDQSMCSEYMRVLHYTALLLFSK